MKKNAASAVRKSKFYEMLFQRSNHLSMMIQHYHSLEFYIRDRNHF